MTEQQANSPIDDLFRKTFENLPDSAAESGWDTPSERVWENIQTNISGSGKTWGTKSLILMAVLAIAVAGGLYWMLTRNTDKPAVSPPPVITPVEQPVATPSTAPEIQPGNQPVVAPKPSSGNGTTKDTQSKPAPRNTTEEQKAKPGENTAQPLPGSKSTLPPNTTEAKKGKGGNN